MQERYKKNICALMQHRSVYHFLRDNARIFFFLRLSDLQRNYVVIIIGMARAFQAFCHSFTYNISSHIYSSNCGKVSQKCRLSLKKLCDIIFLLNFPSFPTAPHPCQGYRASAFMPCFGGRDTKARTTNNAWDRVFIAHE